MEEFIMGMVSKYPVLVAVFAVIGVLRAINKPLFSFLRTFVLATPGLKDDALLSAVEGSSIYKGISYVLDWSLSIKLPAAK